MDTTMKLSRMNVCAERKNTQPACGSSHVMFLNFFFIRQVEKHKINYNIRQGKKPINADIVDTILFIFC